MPSDLLEQKITECQMRLDRLSGVISRLQQERDYETRADERLRIADKLAGREQERQGVEAELAALERERSAGERQRLMQEARRLERIKAFREATEVWEQLRSYDPANAQIDNEIQRLKNRLQQSRRLAEDD